MPSPMSTIPMANHPSTPTEIMVSSVRRESERLGSGFESESDGFTTIDTYMVLKNKKTDVEDTARIMPSTLVW